MIYLKDYYNNFENICDRLDEIEIFTNSPSLRYRTIEFHTYLDQLKETIANGNKLQKGSFNIDFMEKILCYEEKFEVFQTLNNNNNEIEKFNDKSNKKKKQKCSKKIEFIADLSSIEEEGNIFENKSPLFTVFSVVYH